MTYFQHVPADMRPYFDLIDEGLSAHDKDFSPDLEFNIPTYIRHMCERLLARIRADRPEATMNEVLVAERCASGHTDYHRRLARDCAKIARNNFGISFAKSPTASKDDTHEPTRPHT